MNATTNDPGSEIRPREARTEFLNSKKGSVKQSTLRAYEFPTRNFVEFCESRGVDAIADVGGHIIERWKAERWPEVKQITLHNNVKHLRVFIRWCETTEYIEYGTADRMDIPTVTRDQSKSFDVLEAERALPILDYLEKFEYGTRKHAMFHTIWHTGCRSSGAISLDVDDFEPSSDGVSVMKFRNRRATGTPLKNRAGSERNVSISPEVTEVLQDYIRSGRTPMTDEYDREPLFTTPSKRVTRQYAYKDYTALTRPCVLTNECPHDRSIPDCSAAQYKKSAPECPSSESLHPIRRGSITHHLNQGWPKEKLSERVDVSVDVLKKHYDARTNEKEREGREQYLDLM